MASADNRGFVLTMQFIRKIGLEKDLEAKSVLLLGPRRTGKSWLIRNVVKPDLFFNLLLAETYTSLNQRPGLLRERLTPSTRLIAIDEIQRIPSLMDEIHALIEDFPEIRFLLSGSSARKLRQQHTSLMAGRARTRHLFPLVGPELPSMLWPLEKRLVHGSLPAVVTADDPWEELKDYTGDYLREEIAAEGYARNLDAFSRFLPVAAACQAGEVNFEKVASDCQVPARTVREYFHILEDTLIGTLLPTFKSGSKRKPTSKPKFFLFDIGVHNALAGKRALAQADSQLGTAMESVVFQELCAYLSYVRDDRPLTYWRTQTGQEVDFVVGDELAIEVKSTRLATDSDAKGLRAFAQETVLRRRLLVTRDPHRRTLADGTEVLPFETFSQALWSGEFAV